MFNKTPKPIIFISHHPSDNTESAKQVKRKLYKYFRGKVSIKRVQFVQSRVSLKYGTLKEISNSDAVLVVIGKGWLQAVTQELKHGKFNAIRIELETAIELHKPTFLLVAEDVQLPAREALPPTLQALFLYAPTILVDATSLDQQVQALYTKLKILAMQRKLISIAAKNMERSNFKVAIGLLTETIKISSDFARPYYIRGFAHHCKKNYEAAFADYTQALDIEPHYFAAYNNRGILRYEKENHAAAIVDYTEAIRIDPCHTSAYNNRALAYQALGDLELALEDMKEAIRLNPTPALFYHNLGKIYFAMGDHSLAIANYTEAIRINPSDANTYRSRAKAYEVLQKYKQAVVDYKRYLKFYDGEENNDTKEVEALIRNLKYR